MVGEKPMLEGRHFRSVAAVFSLTVFWASIALGSTWQMKQRDMQHTGRADYTVPADRLNSTFFDAILWQTRARGPLSSTSMSFFDGAGPKGTDIIVAGYHWPKGVQGMDRQTGQFFWAANPSGGETIGVITPAFSNDGETIYVVNDATDGGDFPQGHPLMAFSPIGGPAAGYRHNGHDPHPGQLSMLSPTIAPDGRIFLHSWVDRPYAGQDDGSAISTVWSAASWADCGLSDPSLYDDGDQLRVVIGARYGQIKAYDGTSGADLWATSTGRTVDAPVTIDPANGNIYVACGDSSVSVAGLDKNGTPLWGPPASQVYQYIESENNPQRAGSAGCLSHDGQTFYFQTNSSQGDGRLYAINTASGSLKWSYPTQAAGWEDHSSCPIVTQNAVVIVGNNYGRTYYAILDEGTQGTLLDTLTVADDGNARASATLSPDGKLYLPMRTVWTASNGDGDIPNQKIENLYTALDVTGNPPAPKLPPPAGQQVVALNHAVALSWKPVDDPNGYFDHYAIYRDTAPFTSIEGRTPMATVDGRTTTSHTDMTAVNGTGYYYAVTSVTTAGGEFSDVKATGPRTPRDETDLQVVTITRTPQYPRYWPGYTNWPVTEPSGFGPYWSGAADRLEDGQTADTQRWPEIGDPVTYTATVRNRGTNPWSGTLTGQWLVDGAWVEAPSESVALKHADLTTFAITRPWDGQLHDIRFAIDVSDARPANDSLTIGSKSVAFLTYADVDFVEQFREDTADYPQATTDDLFDWLNRHMERFNEMFAEAGCPKRVHYDVLEMINDSDPDPDVRRILFAIFPFRYYVTDGHPRGSGYYHAAVDIDYGLLHEMGHQLGLVDLYQLDLPPARNEVSGQGYSAVACLMHGCSPFLSKHSAMAMTHWLDKAHGYYGQYMYSMPAEIRLRVLGFDGRPLPGATVKMYQKANRTDVGQYITRQIKAQGVTDANGEWILPSVPIDPARVPPSYAGDVLHDNPFGYLSVVGENALLHFRVEYDGGVDYAWLDTPEVNIAYWEGQTQTAVFERRLGLGGERQNVAPADMTELNATDWSAWAQGSDDLSTYVEDDTVRRVVGAGSVKFVTDGGYDTYLRYPRSVTAMWDLSCTHTLRMNVYAENPNFSFQECSPWIRLKDADNNYFEYRYYRWYGCTDLLNEAYNRWQYWEIPLDPTDTEGDGWRRTVVGTPDLSRIQYLEIHADTWGGGFTLWFDGVSFDVPGHTPADFNHDCSVDRDDLTPLIDCLLGPAVAQTDPACQETDLDGDGDVDQSDFGFLQRCLSGPGIAADPHCAD